MLIAMALLCIPPQKPNSHRSTSPQVMLAAYYGHADLVKLLIQRGADPNRLNDRGQSPLAGAVFKKEDAVIEARPVTHNLSSDVLTLVQILLEGGADPDYGSPSAMQCISMFKQEEQWKDKFESAPGKGKAVQ